MISKETIDKILSAARIEEVVGDFVQLKKAGANYKGLSPFKNEKTPSFVVSPAKGIYKDFSTGKGGSAVSFLMEHEKISYPDALRYLARKYNIEIEEKELSPEQIQENNERESLYVVLQYAQEYFTRFLWTEDEGKSVGLSYFRERGFGDNIINKFKLGYHPEGRDKFAKEAVEAGYRQEYLEKLGLIKNREGRIFDFFHGRVMFPIHNLSGRVIGFGGRVLRSDKEVAKYFNSPESEVYNKSKTLYGIFQAKNRMVAEDNCFLVEGYTDVLALHQAGVENAVASSGTSLTTDQIQLIKRFTQNVTILYDGDEAGIKASFRGLNMILEAGMNVKVVLFPDGDDPDSYSRKVSTDELKTYLKEKAQDFISYKAGLLLKESGKDPIKRAGVIRDIVESIALVPDSILRSTYVQTTSTILELSETVLLTELNKIRKQAVREEFKKSETALPLPPESELFLPDEVIKQGVSLEFSEREIVRVMINYGHMDFDYHHEYEGNVQVGRLNVVEFISGQLEADDFVLESPIYRKIYELICTEYRELPSQLINHQDTEVRNTAASLVDHGHILSENWKSKHYIFTQTEDHLLERLVKACLYDYLLKRVEKEIEQSQNRLKEEQNEEEIYMELSKQKAYLVAKGRFAAEMKRTILR